MSNLNTSNQQMQEITLNENVGGISANTNNFHKKKGNAHTRNQNIAGFIMGGIPLLGRILFTFIPIFIAIAMAFMEKPRMTSFEGAEFVGFDNFKAVLTDSEFWLSMKNTCIYLISLPITLVISILLACALNANIKFKGLFRTIIMIPFVCSTVAIVFVFKRMYNTNYGVLNAILGTNIGWLSDSPGMFRTSLIIMMVWSGCGYRTLLLTAALTSVNTAYYEAAEIDGANVFDKFFKITLPSISPTLFYLLVTGCAGALQVFGESQVMASDGGQSVGMAGLTVVFYLYRQLQWTEMGMACAAALVLSGIILIITLINFKLQDKWVRYE